MAKDVRKPAAKSKPKGAPVKAKPPAKAASAKTAAKSVAKSAVTKAAVRSAAVKVQKNPTTAVKVTPKPVKAPPHKTAPSKAPASKAASKASAAAVTSKGKTTPISAPKAKPAKAVSPITAPRKSEAVPSPKANGSLSIAPQSKPVTGKVMSKKSSVDIATMKLPEGYRPSDDEPFMGPHHRAYFRYKLQKWKDDIIKETMETLQVLHDDTLQHPDLADRATHETDRALELRARDRQRKLISKIESAIRRIDDGTYGYCEETGEPISLKRLDARPVATLSLEAQERHERRERVYRDE